MSETRDYVASVMLCDRSWFGHPEGKRVGENYREASTAAGAGVTTTFPWSSGLRCWHLLDADGNRVGRAFEPTAETPRWVWANKDGTAERNAMISMDRLQVLMVEYRLRGGAEV